MSFLAHDGSGLLDNEHKLYEIGVLDGIIRLSQPWKYHLHHTMGRPIIVENKIWNW